MHRNSDSPTGLLGRLWRGIAEDAVQEILGCCLPAQRGTVNTDITLSRSKGVQ